MSVVCKLYDLQSNLLADISAIALEKTLRRRKNQARQFTITAPAGHELLTTVAGDGYPNLRRGNRKLLVWEDDEIIFHGRVFVVERNGSGQQNPPEAPNLVTITAFDPWMELGYEADDRAGRPVRGSSVAGGAYDGNFIDPKFVSSVDGGAAISGPDLIKQVLENSMNTGDEPDPTPGEGPLPISLTGTFDLTVPPAVDLSVLDFMDWPILVGDFVNQLVETNVVDVDMRPVDPTEGFDPYVMVELSAVSSQGSDRTGSVHFDYWTGSFNAKQCRHVDDFATVCNKLYDYLAPRRTPERFAGNITPTLASPALAARISASRALYGEFMQIRAFDTLGVENSSRPLYEALWNAEQSLRVEPREMLFITPSPDAAALFTAPQDFDVGDLVAVNVGDEFGLELALAQRVYGYDKTWDRQNVARLSELLTSADAE